MASLRNMKYLYPSKWDLSVVSEEASVPGSPWFSELRESGERRTLGISENGRVISIQTSELPSRSLIRDVTKRPPKGPYFRSPCSATGEMWPRTEATPMKSSKLRGER